MAKVATRYTLPSWPSDLMVIDVPRSDIGCLRAFEVKNGIASLDIDCTILAANQYADWVGSFFDGYQKYHVAEWEIDSAWEILGEQRFKNGAYFGLARRYKAIPAFQGCPIPSCSRALILRDFGLAICEEVYCFGEGDTESDDDEMVVHTYNLVFDQVRLGEGQTPMSLASENAREKLAAGAFAGIFPAKLGLVLALAVSLSEIHDGKPFPFGQVAVADAMGIQNHQDANRLIREAEKRGFIKVERKPNAIKSLATVVSWTGPAI